MDFITQIALGGVIGYICAGKSKAAKHSKNPLIIGSILGAAPDADVLINFGNDVNDFIYHRSFTHSVLILFLVSVVLYFISYKKYKNTILSYHISNIRWFLLLLLPLITHPILDSFTVYGTQIFWPFFIDLNGRPPESWSTLFIIDPLYSLPLFIAYAGIIFNPTISYRHISILFFLSCSYLAWSNIAKHLNDKKIRDYIIEKNLKDTHFVSTPTPFNTFLWRTIIMKDEHYYIVYNNIFKKIKSLNIRQYKNNKNLLSPINNKSLEKLHWFTHGFYKLDKKEDHIIATDLRMGIEDAYVFRFTIKNTNQEKNNAEEKPFRVKEKIDIQKIKDIFKHF